MCDNYKPPDNLMEKLDPYFLSEDCFSNWSKWNMVSFLECANKRKPCHLMTKEISIKGLGTPYVPLKSDLPVKVKEVVIYISDIDCLNLNLF
jgi:hypothetical protein